MGTWKKDLVIVGFELKNEDLGTSLSCEGGVIWWQLFTGVWLGGLYGGLVWLALWLVGLKASLSLCGLV